jgi:hypothetical protein
VRHPREELAVDSEAAVKRLRSLSHHAHCKLVLVHDDGGTKHWPVCEQFERQWGRDTVRNVRDAEVKVGEFRLEKVGMDDLQLLLERRALKSASQLKHLDNITFACPLRQYQPGTKSVRSPLSPYSQSAGLHARGQCELAGARPYQLGASVAKAAWATLAGALEQGKACKGSVASASQSMHYRRTGC